MSGVLVLAEARRGELRAISLELIGAALALSEQGAGPVSVAIIGDDGEVHAQLLGPAGVQDVLVVPAPQPHFEAHVTQAAVEALIERRRPAVVLAGHTIDSLGFAPAVAARLRLGFASNVTGADWGEDGLLARRGAYGEKLIAELDFPDKETVLLLLRPGAFAPVEGAPAASAERVELDLEGRARTEHREMRDPPAGDVDITKSDFLLSIGRGVEDEEQIAELEQLAERMGATLSASRPLVDAGLISAERQVGQSGRTVTPKVYLALGISGAVQHLAGMSKAQTIIAVNSDPEAPIFSVAQYGAVADLFEVAAELERQFG
ncbi:MAG TPA: electron transfer flavoprotein subunit alpha/FixB family protein [Solirubrobacteraceae bacterium]|jgi:electron transfer flavoprotein alpha subunit|nr:electron transfer flavoprotein subunit alpha/FixB family protein [Solirubrobacteraceae bacterium]